MKDKSLIINLFDKFGSPVKWTTMSTLPVMERNKSMCLKHRKKFTTKLYRGRVK